MCTLLRTSKYVVQERPIPTKLCTNRNVVNLKNQLTLYASLTGPFFEHFHYEIVLIFLSKQWRSELTDQGGQLRGQKYQPPEWEQPQCQDQWNQWSFLLVLRLISRKGFGVSGKVSMPVVLPQLVHLFMVIFFKYRHNWLRLEIMG